MAIHAAIVVVGLNNHIVPRLIFQSYIEGGISLCRIGSLGINLSIIVDGVLGINISHVHLKGGATLIGVAQDNLLTHRTEDRRKIIFYGVDRERIAYTQHAHSVVGRFGGGVGFIGSSDVEEATQHKDSTQCHKLCKETCQFHVNIVLLVRILILKTSCHSLSQCRDSCCSHAGLASYMLCYQ